MIKFQIYIRTNNLILNRWMNTGEYSYNFENAVKKAQQLAIRMKRRTELRVSK